MIKKLKIKFIALAMISMFVLLTLIITTVNIINYNYVISDTDKALKIFLHENDFDDDPDDKEEPLVSKPPRSDKMKRPKSKIPDTYMVDEYYSVLISPEGEVIGTDRDHISWLSEENAEKYALLAYEESAEKGSVGIFRYHIDSDEENTLITLMNIDRELSACRKFLFISLFVGLCGYIVISIAIIFYSGRLIRPIAESYKRQKRFITDAGHELKTPLAIINANTDLLEMDIGGNEVLNEIRHQVQRLTDLTDDLVYLSRMEESDNNISMTDFPISELIHDVLYTFKATALTQEINFSYDIQPSLSYEGNSRSIEQLISILMENSLKYTPNGGRIEATLMKKGKQLIFTMFNTTANAIYEENLGQIFERFYRAETSRNSETGGHGIGLSVAKAIVTAHNGKISATTDDGYSFRLTVTLPTK